MRAFVGQQVTPFPESWEKAGLVDRAVWLAAEEQGRLVTDVPERYGGGGGATSGSTASSGRSWPCRRERRRACAAQRRDGAELAIARTHVDQAVLERNAGHFIGQDAAMAKWRATEPQKRVVDACVQLHGGYGYMLEYRSPRPSWTPRVQTIHGGTTEFMKEIIGRSLGV